MKRNKSRPFQERCATACKNETFDYTFSPHNYLCLIKILALLYYMHLKQHFFLSASFRFSFILLMYKKIYIYFLGLCDYIFDPYIACLTLSFNTAYVNFHSIPFTSRCSLESPYILKVVCPLKLPLGSQNTPRLHSSLDACYAQLCVDYIHYQDHV